MTGFAAFMAVVAFGLAVVALVIALTALDGVIALEKQPPAAPEETETPCQ